MFICAITGSPLTSVGEACALFRRRRRKQKENKAIIANVTKPAALPIPAFAEFGSLNFGLASLSDSELLSLIDVGVRKYVILVVGFRGGYG